MLRIITRDEVNEAYLESLRTLSRKIAFYKAQKDNKTLAAFDMKRKLKALKNTAAQKVHQFLMRHLICFKDLESLAQLQQQIMPYSFCYQFLFKHAKIRSEEVLIAYIEASSKHYTNYCKAYSAALLRCKAPPIPRTGTIGAPEARAKVSEKGKVTNAFSLASRYHVLTEMDKPPISPPVYLKDSPLAFEYLFRSMLFLLMELATREGMFCNDFFLVSTADVPRQVFSKLVALYLEYLTTYADSTFDTVGIVILMCTVEKYYEVMGRRRVQCLNELFEASMRHLTARFKAVVEVNLESLQLATPRTMGSCNVGPHYVTRRYVELVGSLLTLAGHGAEDPDGKPKEWLLKDGNPLEGVYKAVFNELAPLRKEMEGFLARMAQSIADPAKRCLFYINNFDVILMVLEKRKIVSEDTARFTLLQNEALQNFVSELTHSMKFFANMMAFVDQLRKIKYDHTAMIKLPNFNRDYVEGLLRDFHLHWREGVEAMKQLVTQSFSSFQVGQDLFQRVVEVLVTYYSELVQQVVAPHMSELTTIDYFMPDTTFSYEVKKLGFFK
eukprot:TRINITY_DN610_c0_g2_i3.p1 TRINITY_DN610_c0_g2~~TRINITY_DN610_c0_g2_i3.p1  ORF type:complete len:555 (+),score=189.68 TRINITY_DN610_c0_g2_i3:758-2422(+)